MGKFKREQNRIARDCAMRLALRRAHMYCKPFFVSIHPKTELNGLRFVISANDGPARSWAISPSGFVWLTTTRNMGPFYDYNAVPVSVRCETHEKLGEN